MAIHNKSKTQEGINRPRIPGAQPKASEHNWDNDQKKQGWRQDQD